MKKSIVIIAAGLVAVASAEERVGVATVSNVAASQDTRTDVLTVTYDLENTQNNESLFVTMDILTNGVSIGKNIFKSVSGDISSDSTDLIAPGTGKQIVWEAATDWPDQFSTNATVKVSAYYADRIDCVPGIYMKIALGTGSSYPIVYTMKGPAVDAEGHIVNNEDRGDYLWMRRIEACPQGFVMGAEPDEVTSDYYYRAREAKHTVVLSKPFFAAIFPITRRQYRYIMGQAQQDNPNQYAPIGGVSYDLVRGGTTSWPSDKYRVDNGSVAANLRAKTNDLGFDLPTEAQWEYMCRAGTDTAWNNGTTIGNATTDSNLDVLGWYKSNAPAAATQVVGQKKPNAWGIYDCHGNAWEWCLDRYQEDITALTRDPVGPTDGTEFVMRGGSYENSAHDCRSARREKSSRGTAGANYGFRLVLPLER